MQDDNNKSTSTAPKISEEQFELTITSGSQTEVKLRMIFQRICAMILQGSCTY